MLVLGPDNFEHVGFQQWGRDPAPTLTRTHHLVAAVVFDYPEIEMVQRKTAKECLEIMQIVN